MPYTLTDWVDGVTPVNAFNLDKVEAGLVTAQATAEAAQTAAAAAVAKDSVVIAGTRLVATKLAGGDTQPAFQILGDGKQSWGLGGTTAADTFLYRSAAGVLRSDGRVESVQGFKVVEPDTTTGRAVFDLLVSGETYSRWQVNQVGTLSWGAGGATNLDTNLYRVAANTLTTGKFQVGATAPVTKTPLLSVISGGNNIEFGHTNPSGYRSTLGAFGGSGTPFLLFSGEEGTTNDTVRTRGFMAMGLSAQPGQNTLAVISAVTANADNQTPVTLATFDVNAAAGQSYLNLSIPNTGMRRVEIGPTDTGGTGYRYLRVLN